MVANLEAVLTPYITEAVVSLLGGLMNPIGFFYVIASALPSTLGANAGLLSLPSLIAWRKPVWGEAPVAPISRSMAWIAAGAVASLVFIFILGRGLTWTR